MRLKCENDQKLQELLVERNGVCNWVTGDVMSLYPQFQPSDVDIVLDKGTLDAIVSSGDENHFDLGIQMLTNIFQTSNRYLVITLGQDYVMKVIEKFIEDYNDNKIQNGESSKLIVDVSGIFEKDENEMKKFLPFCVHIHLEEEEDNSELKLDDIEYDSNGEDVVRCHISPLCLPSSQPSNHPLRSLSHLLSSLQSTHSIFWQLCSLKSSRLLEFGFSTDTHSFSFIIVDYVDDLHQQGIKKVIFCLFLDIYHISWFSNKNRILISIHLELF